MQDPFKKLMVEDLPEVIESLGGKFYLELLGQNYPNLFINLITKLYPKQTMPCLGAIPGIEAMNLLERADAVVSAMLSGNMPPDVCKLVLETLKAQSELQQAAELIARVEALEACL